MIPLIPNRVIIGTSHPSMQPLSVDHHLKKTHAENNNNLHIYWTKILVFNHYELILKFNTLPSCFIVYRIYWTWCMFIKSVLEPHSFLNFLLLPCGLWLHQYHFGSHAGWLIPWTKMKIFLVLIFLHLLAPGGLVSGLLADVLILELEKYQTVHTRQSVKECGSWQASVLETRTDTQ